MKTSESGLHFIEIMEGRRFIPYQDQKGIFTCGVGHRLLPGEDISATWSEAKIEEVLAADLAIAEAPLNSFGIPLSQPQFDALVSLIFNIGVHAFEGSMVKTDLMKLRYRSAADAFLLWADHGLAVSRRQAERGVFLYGCEP